MLLQSSAHLGCCVNGGGKATYPGAHKGAPGRVRRSTRKCSAADAMQVRSAHSAAGTDKTAQG
eukprot:11271781-Alexandrium_andersonii.AAC.1